MPNRIIRESITTSHSWDDLSFQAESFCTRLITVVDDYGRMDARPSVLRAKCFPLKLSKVTDKMIAAWLEELIDSGMVIVYVAEGGQYLQFRNWPKYQNVRAKESKFPQPPASAFICDQMRSRSEATLQADDRKCDQVIADVPVTRISDLGSRNSDLDTRISGIEESGASADTKELPRPPFNLFWDSYLREKGHKGEAEKAWNKLSSEEQWAAVDSLPNYSASKRVKDGYVRNASTYLNGRIWEQFLEPEPTAQSGIDAAFQELERRQQEPEKVLTDAEVIVR